MAQIAHHSEDPTARSVVAYYVMTIVLAAFVLLFRGKLAATVDLVAGAFYLLMTAFFYQASARRTRR